MIPLNCPHMRMTRIYKDKMLFRCEDGCECVFDFKVLGVNG